MFLCVVSLYNLRVVLYFGEGQNANNTLKCTAILHTKTSNKRFIIQLQLSINLSMKDGECDGFVCTCQPVRQTGFLLYKYHYMFVLLFGRCSLQLDIKGGY